MKHGTRNRPAAARKHFIGFRVTTAERERLAKLARKMGLTVTQLLLSGVERMEKAK